jgi:ribosomal protein S18 acetylase RimI-like enzyme
MDLKTDIAATTTLGPRESEDLAALLAAGEAADGFARLEMEKTLNAHADMPSFYLAYDRGSLVGALSIFAPESDEAELGALVLPEARRRAVFGALLARAELELERFGYKDELFVVDSRSASGKAAAASLGAAHEYTEYEMRYEGGPPLASVPGLRIEPVGIERIEELIALRTEDFGGSREDAESFERATFASPARRQYAAFVNGRMVGACSLGFEERSVSINGLAIERASQGRGYGQALLAEMLRTLSGSGLEILLDVESRNANALHIYKKAGFAPLRAVDYHRRGLGQRVDRH